MIKNIFFFLPKGTINEATEYYCELLKRALENSNYRVVTVEKRKEIGRNDNVLTIRYADQFKVFFKGKRKLINWFQGIGPEEYLMLKGDSLKVKFISFWLSIFERYSLQRSDLCVFVSEKMMEHYEHKYKISLSSKSVIIPCYNKPLVKAPFFIEKRYDDANFVYAGGMFAWQCVEETLEIYKEVCRLNDKATLTILTGDRVEAERLVKKHNVKNVFIDFSPLNELQDRLSTFKYAFLIRKNHIVNNVSTPTKMNSYLAAGLIPIYTFSVCAFEKNIKLDSAHALKIDLETENSEDIARKIVNHHLLKISPISLFNDFESVFKLFYNDDLYTGKIKL